MNWLEGKDRALAWLVGLLISTLIAMGARVYTRQEDVLVRLAYLEHVQASLTRELAIVTTRQRESEAQLRDLKWLLRLRQPPWGDSDLP